ncbi:nucleotide-binding universal stress UspA family protein [Friedmanniella endophytica]|uniref:Nucleotide-binding universal stress UspA family protein n=1 Tax=Microlunatus kandeliicorticis TaxID=1759536 RepID=A0A7W3P4H1_9ACTN|nr:universal stress protein [Microlunatus kandeliicorticis]MBA8792913.1 nucleotide-binding universal stress UspA family protein [Microlunatus kandeliicorticis]
MSITGAESSGASEQRRRTVLVGVTPDPSEAVLHAAARLATDLGAGLVCGCADVSEYVADLDPDGTPRVEPLDPDLVEDEERSSRLAADLRHRVRTVLHQFSGDLRVQLLAGDPASALNRLAHDVDADYLVVGARHGGLRAAMSEFFGGSIAVQLVHRQTRPVLVVPDSPVVDGGPLPWETHG